MDEPTTPGLSAHADLYPETYENGMSVGTDVMS